MTVDEMKKRYGGRNKQVNDSCNPCYQGSNHTHQNPTEYKEWLVSQTEGRKDQQCTCLISELEAGKFYITCRRHGDQDEINRNDELIRRNTERFGKKQNEALQYPPRIPQDASASKKVEDDPIVTIWKHAPGTAEGWVAVNKRASQLGKSDDHMGAVEADVDLESVYSEYGG